MKKIKIIALSVLAFVTITSVVFVSCQKNSSTQKVTLEETSTLLKIVSLKNNYTNIKIEQGLNKKKYFDMAFDDMLGCATGCEIGALAGPFGILCGGLSLGVYASVRDYDGYSVINSTNPTYNIPSLSQNPYDYMGYIHNMTLKNILDEHSDYLTNGVLNFQVYFEKSSVYFKTFQQFSNFNMQLNDFNSYTNNFSNIYSNDLNVALNNLCSNYQMTTNTKNILNEYWNTMKSLNTHEDRINYYKYYVDILNQSSDLNDSEKIIILSTSSIGIYSILFNSANA